MDPHRGDRNRDGVGRVTGSGKRAASPVGMFELYRRRPYPLCGDLRQIAALQEKVQTQQETVNLLKNQLDRQASTNADLQRQLARPPAIVQTVPPLYAYPPVGFSLYMGSPWIYGPPYYSSPFFYGPRYYGPHHRGHRW